MMTRAHVCLLTLVALLMVAAGSLGTASASPPVQWAHAAPTHLPLGPAVGQSTPPPAVYDEQIGITYGQDFASIAYNVTAVAQVDSDGYGPAYLLNGLTDSGYWYQVGVSYDWPYSNGGFQPGFAMNFEVFDTAQNSVFPAGGGGGLDNFTGPVASGDNVLLSLSFSGGNVVMSVRDWNTGTTGREVYAAHGSRFVGLSAASDSNGYFTGLMTEWYHVNAYYGSQAEVTYSAKSPVGSGIMWADEFNANTMALVFGNTQSVTFSSPNQLQSFSSNGATSYADSYRFITGALNTAALTLSFNVVGGGSSYAPPVLSYTLDGAAQTATLTQSPTTYYADKGSPWQVSSSLPGSSASERWQTSQQASGTADAAAQLGLTYYHQYLYSFGYSVDDGGSGYAPPSVQTVQFGASVSLASGAGYWVDAGSSYSYSSTLPGSSASERWVLLGSSGSVTGPGAATLVYQHQYAVTVLYSVVGGGTPAAPALNGTQGGHPLTTPISNSTSYFLDAGTQWSVSSVLPGSTTQERWTTSQTTSGTASASTGLSMVYRHQYSLTARATPEAGGSAGITTVWADAGSTLQVTQTANQGWQFGGWNGTGTGSYSGGSAAATVTVGSPIVETVSFNPGLQLSAGSDGAVSYSYAGTSGTVPAGTSTTIYAPAGTRFVLQANPSSLLYAFAGWAQGANRTSAQVSVTLDAPTAMQASFALNGTVVAGAGAAVAAVVAASAYAIRRRRRAPL